MPYLRFFRLRLLKNVVFSVAAVLQLSILSSCNAQSVSEQRNPCWSKDLSIIVATSVHTMYLCNGSSLEHAHHVRLGRGGVGKKREGDNKVPLGIYSLGSPRVSSSFGIFVPIGYPTVEQSKQGYTGSAVGIHGPHRWAKWLGRFVNTFDTTAGCVGVANDDEMKSVADWINRLRVRIVELR